MYRKYFSNLSFIILKWQKYELLHLFKDGERRQVEERKTHPKWLSTAPSLLRRGHYSAWRGDKHSQTAPWAHCVGWCSSGELSAVLWAEVANACKLILFSNLSYKGKADVHVQLTQTHWERLQTFSHFNYHNLMSRIHAQMLFMAEDQHIPCNANQVPKLLYMHCSFSEKESLHWIWVQNVLTCSCSYIFKDCKGSLPGNFHYRFLRSCLLSNICMLWLPLIVNIYLNLLGRISNNCNNVLLPHASLSRTLSWNGKCAFFWSM